MSKIYPKIFTQQRYGQIQIFPVMTDFSGTLLLIGNSSRAVKTVISRIFAWNFVKLVSQSSFLCTHNPKKNEIHWNFHVLFTYSKLSHERARLGANVRDARARANSVFKNNNKQKKHCETQTCLWKEKLCILTWKFREFLLWVFSCTHPISVEYSYTVWKVQNFPVTQILREINFGE